MNNSGSNKEIFYRKEAEKVSPDIVPGILKGPNIFRIKSVVFSCLI